MWGLPQYLGAEAERARVSASRAASRSAQQARGRGGWVGGRARVQRLGERSGVTGRSRWLRPLVQLAKAQDPVGRGLGF